MTTWLAPIRVSRLTDASNSPEGQRERIQEYAEEKLPGDEIIWVDVDMDVSGGVPIRQRPGFGAWLAPDKIGAIDGGFLFDEADRLSRDMLDFLQFARDMAALEKVIVDISDGTDTSTEKGRQAFEDRILAAQRERERVAMRRGKAALRISNAGGWGGGPKPFGYMPVCKCHGERACPEPVIKKRQGWRLVRDPAEAAIVKWMVEERIAGKGFAAIAVALNAKGIPSSRHGISRKGQAHAGTWNATSVSKLLTSPRLLGQVVEMRGGKGRKGDPGYKKASIVAVRRGKDGQPVTFTDQPLVGQETWDELQAAIKAGARARGQAQSRHLLYRVLFCRTCSPKPLDPETAIRMYGSRRHTGRHSAYYSCRSCGQNLRIDRIEPLVEALVLGQAGDRVLLERHVIPGDDHAADVSRLERAAEKRRELLADDPDDADLRKSLASTEEQIAGLRSQPHEPDTAEWRQVENGITVAAHWAALDIAGRAKFLRDWEVSSFADREGAETRLGWLEVYSEAFRLLDNRLCPTAMPALVSHAQEWQRVQGAVRL